SPLIPTVSDPGFEWVSVAQPPGFIHGMQASAIVPDWTFLSSTDSPKNSNWYAGIAVNAGPYTSKNPPAPQGLQVGFIQGDSSISQMVTLAPGRYTLTLEAALSGTYKSAQSMLVKFAGSPIGTVSPVGTKYASHSFSITVTASGTYPLVF